MKRSIIIGALLALTATLALAAGGLKVPPTTAQTGDGHMTHGGAAYSGATFTAGTPDTLTVEGVAGTFFWDGDRYVNSNGFYYRFTEYFHWIYGDKWIGEFGGVSGPITTAAFRYGMAN